MLLSQKTTGLLYDRQSFAMKPLRHPSVLSNGSLIHSNSTRFKKRSSIPLQSINICRGFFTSQIRSLARHSGWASTELSRSQAVVHYHEPLITQSVDESGSLICFGVVQPQAVAHHGNTAQGHGQSRQNRMELS